MKPMGNRSKILPITIVVPLAFLLAPQLQQVANASSNSPYESGRDHGCDDAEISDVDDRYINQPEKGPSFHTNEFMRGYNAGYDDCSGDGSGAGRGSGSNNGNNDRGEGRNFVGSYADGYEVGKPEGLNDWNSRNQHDSKCPPNDSLLWCGGYKVGYEVGWSAGGN